MVIKKGTLDELLSGRDPKQVFSKDGLFDELKKALAERVLNAELDEHLDGEAAADNANHRNGYSKKTVLTGSAKLDLRIPRESPKHVRSKADCPISAPVSRLRREDRVDVGARHDGPGDPGPSDGDLRARCLARPDLEGHGRGTRDGRRMAEPAARAAVPSGFLLCAAAQDPR